MIKSGLPLNVGVKSASIFQLLPITDPSLISSKQIHADLSPVGIELSFQPSDGTLIKSSFPSTSHFLPQSCSKSFLSFSKINHLLQPELAAPP